MNKWVQEQSNAFRSEDTVIEQRIKARINEQQTGWNWFKKSISAGFISMGKLGDSTITSVKDTSEQLGEKVKNLSKKVFQCYDEEKNTEFEIERRIREKKYQTENYNMSSVTNIHSGRHDTRSRNYTDKTSKAITTKNSISRHYVNGGNNMMKSKEESYRYR